MQEIIQTLPPTGQIFESNLPSNPVIGFQTHSGSKGWLQPIDHCSSIYQALAAHNGVASGNRWTIPSGATKAPLHEWLSWLRSDIPARAFLFKSEAELFAWLAQ